MAHEKLHHKQINITQLHGTLRETSQKLLRKEGQKGESQVVSS